MILSSKITQFMYYTLKVIKNSNFLLTKVAVAIVDAIVIIVTGYLLQNFVTILLTDTTPTICNVVSRGNETWSTYCLQSKNDCSQVLHTEL